MFSWYLLLDVAKEAKILPFVSHDNRFLALSRTPLLVVVSAAFLVLRSFAQAPTNRPPALLESIPDMLQNDDWRTQIKAGNINRFAWDVRMRAERGEGLFQYYLARMSYSGFGVAHNMHEFVKWCQKAANNGIPDAQHDLAVAFAYGTGVTQDMKQAIYWYQIAANHDFGPAMHNLARAYGTGRGVPYDLDQSINWFRRAAQKDVPLSQCALGFIESGLDQRLSKLKAGTSDNRDAVDGVIAPDYDFADPRNGLSGGTCEPGEE